MAINTLISEVTLDVYDHDTTPQVIKTIALDNKTRFIHAYLQSHGIDIYQPDRSAKITLTALRPDKVASEVAGSVIELVPAGEDHEESQEDEQGNPITVIVPGDPAVYGLRAEITQAMIAVQGTVLFQFKMESGNEVLRTEIFKADNGRALDADASEWADEYQGYNLDELVRKTDFMGTLIDQALEGTIPLDRAILETHRYTERYINGRLNVENNGIHINTQGAEGGDEGDDERVWICDNTLTVAGAAADAKTVGDRFSEQDNSISLNAENLGYARDYVYAAEQSVNAINKRVKNAYMSRSGMVDNISVTYDRGLIKLNGETSSALVLEADADRITENINYIPYRRGMTSGFFEDNDAARKPVITPGRYHFVINMLSGTVTKSGVEYRSNAEFGSKNVVNAFWIKPDATSSSYTLLKTNISKELDVAVEQLGLQVLYIYAGCSFNNAVFELYVEPVEEEDETEVIGLPEYWNPELDRAIAKIQSNIFSTATAKGSTTVCFITDCHWSANVQRSPLIVRKLFENCNINYFVNGGDLLEGHKTTREEAAAEITDCINAFRGLQKPMITLYGNHDRNRNAQTTLTERHLSHTEHANLVFKSFMPSPDIHRVSNDYQCFYWEDETYRYVGLYWFADRERDLPYLTELFDTDKPVIIFCHGIYFTLAEDVVDDVIDNSWILNEFEPYKDQIKCFVQGHTHRDGLRHAWNTVPIIIIDCDKFNTFSSQNSITEQSIAVITFDTDKISVVKVGKGEDFEVTADSPDWRQEYTNV